jgi:hypothetical protein
LSQIFFKIFRRYDFKSDLKETDERLGRVFSTEFDSPSAVTAATRAKCANGPFTSALLANLFPPVILRAEAMFLLIPQLSICAAPYTGGVYLMLTLLASAGPELRKLDTEGVKVQKICR